FDIDANGILNVTAKDKGSGKEQSISITGASTLSENEVEQMVRDAESNADTDKERRERIDTKNQADSLAYQAEKQVEELGDKVPAEDKEKIEAQVKELKDAIAAEDYDKIKSTMTDLQQALYTLSSNLYQQGSEAAPDAAADTASEPTDSASTSGEDDVIDAEFSETDNQ
ncbi:MAG: Hsp70 family protein, partial [Phormidesmis sp.]